VSATCIIQDGCFCRLQSVTATSRISPVAYKKGGGVTFRVYIYNGVQILVYFFILKISIFFISKGGHLQGPPKYTPRISRARVTYVTSRLSGASLLTSHFNTFFYMSAIDI